METERVVKPGIYRHFKGGLYFVLGLAFDRDHPTDRERAEVIYHPLYQVENLGWRRGISPAAFLEDVPGLPYAGPRFTKIMDWRIPNILPGQVLGSPYPSTRAWYTITKIEQDMVGDVIVSMKICDTDEYKTLNLYSIWDWVQGPPKY